MCSAAICGFRNWSVAELLGCDGWLEGKEEFNDDRALDDLDESVLGVQRAVLLVGFRAGSGMLRGMFRNCVRSAAAVGSRIPSDTSGTTG